MQQPSAHLAGIALTAIPFPLWIIDTCSTNHMCSSLSLFISITLNSSSSHVQIPNGTSALMTHIGSISFTSSFYLDNVLYVSTFKFNMLSVSQLTKSLNCTIIYFPDVCVF